MQILVDPHYALSFIIFSPKNRFFDDFAPPPRVSTHLVGSIPAPKNKKAKADVPKTGASMRLWSKTPLDLPSGFFKP
jgi:hypothetical protein